MTTKTGARGVTNPMKIETDGRPHNPDENVRPAPCRCGFEWSVEKYPYPHDICGRASGEYVVSCPRCRESGPLQARPDWAIIRWNEEREKSEMTTNPQSPDELVEHVARAICWAFSEETDDCSSVCMNAKRCMTDDVADSFKRHARAAIAAMPELSSLQDKIRRLEELIVEMDDHVHDCCGCFSTAPDEMLAQMNEVRARTALSHDGGGV